MKKYYQLLYRLLKHFFTTTAAGKRAFPSITLKAIENEIAAGEAMHRAEIQLMIEAALPTEAILRRISSRERAIELFSQYRVWDTEENCGVLVYINLADRKVEVVADRGVNELLAACDWQAVCQRMTQGFAQGTFNESSVAALSQLNALLKTHFPADSERPNQLPNRPLML